MCRFAAHVVTFLLWEFHIFVFPRTLEELSSAPPSSPPSKNSTLLVSHIPPPHTDPPPLPVLALSQPRRPAPRHTCPPRIPPPPRLYAVPFYFTYYFALLFFFTVLLESGVGCLTVLCWSYGTMCGHMEVTAC